MRWRSYSAAIFDCDSTLSSIEGIDELAVSLDKKEAVGALTDAAMNGDVELDQVYGKRLELLSPTQQQVVRLKEIYKATVVPYARELIELLKSENVETWIVSGGLLDAVREYGIWLGVDEKNIQAVDSLYDPLNGQWWRPEQRLDKEYLGYKPGRLTNSSGKGELIEEVVSDSSRKFMIGDGVSDLAARDNVDLFVAYSGVVSRPAVVENAAVVLKSKSLAAAAALILGPSRIVELLDSDHHDVAAACLASIAEGSLRFNAKDMETKFMGSLEKAMEGYNV